MQCPVCPDAALTMSERSGIEIDYCPKCRGVWLDRGELDKIIDRASASSATPAAAAAAAPPPPQHAQPYRPPPYPPQRRHDDDYHYRKKKRSGFLGELFDFD